jgi:hypothetical protein
MKAAEFFQCPPEWQELREVPSPEKRTMPAVIWTVCLVAVFVVPALALRF